MASVPAAPRHAVVIGGSLAGLCAARALANHIPRVTVVDRDRFPDGPEVRAGVPQAHHLHVLITSGQRALDRLFPGLIAELHDLGAVPVAHPTDILYLGTNGWRERFPATHRLVGASRELIDWTVRRRLLADPRIRFLAGHEAIGLLPGPDGESIVGVALRPRPGGTGTSTAGGTDAPAADGADAPGPGGAEERVERLAADLVVDASGRGSRTPDWLAALGFGRPAESRIDAGLGYASRRYVLPPGTTDGWKNILVLPKPSVSSRGAVLYPIEHDRWMLTLGGLGAEVPPTDEAGFLEFIRTLRTPVLHQVLRDAKPDSPIHGFRRTSNHRRHYETMPRWPANLLVVGDAACAFNPVYGQGMSVAALAAVALDEHLRAHPRVFGRTAQAAVAACAAGAWTIATEADLRFTAAPESRPGPAARLAQWYRGRVSRVADRDQYVLRVLTDVLHLVRPPSALVRPGVAVRVLARPVRPPLAEPPPAPGSPPHSSPVPSPGPAAEPPPPPAQSRPADDGSGDGATRRLSG